MLPLKDTLDPVPSTVYIVYGTGILLPVLHSTYSQTDLLHYSPQASPVTQEAEHLIQTEAKARGEKFQSRYTVVMLATSHYNC